MYQEFNESFSQNQNLNAMIPTMIAIAFAFLVAFSISIEFPPWLQSVQPKQIKPDMFD